jgi:hypothetical protein
MWIRSFHETERENWRYDEQLKRQKDGLFITCADNQYCRRHRHRLTSQSMLLKGVDGDIDDKVISRRNSFDVRNNAELPCSARLG